MNLPDFLKESEKELDEIVYWNNRRPHISGIDTVAQEKLKKLMRSRFNALLERVADMAEGMKRTDDTQMSHDHAYDDALTDLITTLREEAGKNKLTLK